MRFAGISGQQGKVEAALDWIDSLGKDDFAVLIDLLLLAEEGEDLGLGEAEEDLVGEMMESIFLVHEILGNAFFQRWANVSPDSMLDSLERMKPDYVIEMATYVLPYLFATDPGRAGQALAEIERRSPDRFEEEFEPDVFAGRLFQVSEVAAVRWVLDRDPGEFAVEDLFYSGFRRCRWRVGGVAEDRRGGGARRCRV